MGTVLTVENPPEGLLSRTGWPAVIINEIKMADTEIESAKHQRAAVGVKESGMVPASSIRD